MAGNNAGVRVIRELLPRRFVSTAGKYEGCRYVGMMSIGVSITRTHTG